MVDAIMTDQGIETSIVSKKAKEVELTIHNRIELFEKKNPEVAEMLMAIKWIGNEGSHELKGLTRENVVIAYEIIYHCIESYTITDQLN